MNKNFTISNNKCYVTNDHDITTCHENTEDLYQELTLENQLESYKNKLDELNKDKNIKVIKLLACLEVFIISLVSLGFSLTIESSILIFNLMRNIIVIGCLGTTGICTYFLNKNINKIYSMIEALEDKYKDKENELNNLKHTRKILLEENENLSRPKTISKEEYSNLDNKHIISLNTDFSKEYEEIERNTKIRRKIK